MKYKGDTPGGNFTQQQETMPAAAKPIAAKPPIPPAIEAIITTTEFPVSIFDIYYCQNNQIVKITRLLSKFNYLNFL